MQHNLQRNTEKARGRPDCCKYTFSYLKTRILYLKHEPSRNISVGWLHINILSQRPAPLAEVKVSPPKFDLAATNFPPLPGCVVSTQGEPVLENRMADVLRGLYRDKVRLN